MPGKIIPDTFALMAIDPGKTTGVAQGIFRTDKGDDMLVTIFKRAIAKNQIKTWEIKGPSELQAWTIRHAWSAFIFKCNVELGIPIPDIHLVVESFQLRELQAQLYPVEVNYALRALLRRGSVDDHDMLIVQAPKRERQGGFTTALIFKGDKVVRSAPILAYMHGWDRKRVLKRADDRGWTTMHEPEWPLGEPEYQTPSTAKAVKDDRLRRLGLWVTGSTHERDVMRHLVAKVDAII